MPHARGQFVSTVLKNIPLCREHYRLVLGLDAFPATQPGQFVQLSCSARGDAFHEHSDISYSDCPIHASDRELIEAQAYLRRPFSLAGRRDTANGVELEFIHRVVGLGTKWLSQLKSGDPVHLLGPLGNRFALPRQEQTAILVGGGVGIPPMLYLAEALQGRPAIAFCGAVTRHLLPLTIQDEDRPREFDGIEPSLNIAEFSRHGISSVITTDNGSYGFRGYVTQALEQFFDSPRPRVPASPRLLIYTCGPEPMMKRVAEIAADRGIECQIAVERAMACGMGTCQSCCIRVLKPDSGKPPLAGSNWCWRLACTDGPIFRGTDLLW